MREDRFTNTPEDAARYEARRGQADDVDDRPTLAELQRDDCQHLHQSDLAGRVVWPPDYNSTFVCDDCGQVCGRDEAAGFCNDCPDHEACATGWPCWKVKELSGEQP
jgi:hypothetical protein